MCNIVLSVNSVSYIFRSLILTWYQLIRLKLLVYLFVCFKFLWLLMYICIYGIEGLMEDQLLHVFLYMLNVVTLLK